MVTLEQVKFQVRLEQDENEEDTFLDGLIRAAYKWAERHTQSRILPAEVTVTLDGFPSGSTQIELHHTPVRSITSLEYIDTDGAEQSIDEETLRLDTRGVFPLLAPQWGTQWPDTIAEPESVTITMEVGFAEDGEPDDITLAILLLVGHFYNNREGVTNTTATVVPLGVYDLLSDYVITPAG